MFRFVLLFQRIHEKIDSNRNERKNPKGFIGSPTGEGTLNAKADRSGGKGDPEKWLRRIERSSYL
ncbi:hypothetical protein GCM10011418_16590 [Sphingobacterium alkalisoli]|nr:hypothetical protein GCM10011418_16590 [Sphingobacterium alkalisoli]